jgi:hypothetical protein
LECFTATYINSTPEQQELLLDFLQDKINCTKFSKKWKCLKQYRREIMEALLALPENMATILKNVQAVSMFNLKYNKIGVDDDDDDILGLRSGSENEETESSDLLSTSSTFSTSPSLEVNERSIVPSNPTVDHEGMTFEIKPRAPIFTQLGKFLVKSIGAITKGSLGLFSAAFSHHFLSTYTWYTPRYFSIPKVLKFTASFILKSSLKFTRSNVGATVMCMIAAESLGNVTNLTLPKLNNLIIRLYNLLSERARGLAQPDNNVVIGENYLVSALKTVGHIVKRKIGIAVDPTSEWRSTYNLLQCLDSLKSLTERRVPTLMYMVGYNNLALAFHTLVNVGNKTNTHCKFVYTCLGNDDEKYTMPGRFHSHKFSPEVLQSSSEIWSKKIILPIKLKFHKWTLINKSIVLKEEVFRADRTIYSQMVDNKVKVGESYQEVKDYIRAKFSANTYLQADLAKSVGDDPHWGGIHIAMAMGMNRVQKNQKSSVDF